MLHRFSMKKSTTACNYPRKIFLFFMPEGVPEPETLTSAKQLMEPFAEKSSYAKYYAEKSPFDIRHVTRTIMLGADKKSASNDSGKQLVWMKADGTVDVPQVMHRAMLAMGCDQADIRCYTETFSVLSRPFPLGSE